LNVAEVLTDFLRHETEREPHPGACCRIVDRWCLRRLGFSLLSRFGREYRTQEDVDRWLKEPGGIAIAVNRVMRANGIGKTKNPQVGDVGLVVHRARPCMAIKAPSGWISRDDDGFICVPDQLLLKAWRIEE
jgi:hypothetical protein